VERLLLADKVAAAKFGTAMPIEDRVRESQLLGVVRRLSLAVGVDPLLSLRFFEDQIEANKYVQAGLHRRWAAHPELRPRCRPNLSIEVRPRLDELTSEMIVQLGARKSGEPDTSVQPPLDPLHREALRLAMRAVCAVG
jgi:chorismate mutase